MGGEPLSAPPWGGYCLSLCPLRTGLSLALWTPPWGPGAGFNIRMCSPPPPLVHFTLSHFPSGNFPSFIYSSPFWRQRVWDSFPKVLGGIPEQARGPLGQERGPFVVEPASPRGALSPGAPLWLAGFVIRGGQPPARAVFPACFSVPGVAIATTLLVSSPGSSGSPFLLVCCPVVYGSNFSFLPLWEINSHKQGAGPG